VDPGDDSVTASRPTSPHRGCALARPTFDVCLHTNNIVDMQRFWEHEVGLHYEGALVIRGDLDQHRMRVGDSVIKINHYRHPLPPAVQSGYRNVLIARDGAVRTRTRTDPDGNQLTEIPAGDGGIVDLGVILHARDVTATRRFYERRLGLDAEGGDTVHVRVGRSRVIVLPDPHARINPPIQGRGWRFLTLPVVNVDNAFARAVISEHAGIPPRQLGDLARYAFVRDPDGNWIELSQRAAPPADAAPHCP
jgi:catechol 2,3-dioxygenase-like lactoylglutathione lyase family enzyme